jgi:hypothetical protein
MLVKSTALPGAGAVKGYLLGIDFPVWMSVKGVAKTGDPPTSPIPASDRENGGEFRV